MERNEVLIEIFSQKDNLGRQSFSASWIADNIGYRCNETGVRGQHFFAIIDEHVKTWMDKGYKILMK